MATRSEALDYLGKLIDRQRAQRDRDGYTFFALGSASGLLLYSVIEPAAIITATPQRLIALVTLFVVALMSARPIRALMVFLANLEEIEAADTSSSILPVVESRKLYSVAKWGVFERSLYLTLICILLVTGWEVLRFKFYLLMWIALLILTIVLHSFSIDWMLKQLGITAAAHNDTGRVDVAKTNRFRSLAVIRFCVELLLSAVFLFANWTNLVSNLTLGDVLVGVRLFVALLVMRMIIDRRIAYMDISILEGIERDSVASNLEGEQIIEAINKKCAIS